MTFLGQLASMFPVLHVIGIVMSCILLFRSPGISTALLFVACLYLLPPILLRIYTLRYPVKTGRWVLNQPTRCDWWIAHQLQMVYAAVPAIEAILRLVPGAYSAWLRLWGSCIGKRVYWTSRVEIIDRHLLSVGDDAVLAHHVCITSHLIRKKANGDIVLIVRRTRIGAAAFLGTFTRVGPGVAIPDQAVTPYNAEYRFRYVP